MTWGSLNRLRLAPEQMSLYAGEHVFVANRYGLISSGMDGLYVEQTRFLSRYALSSEGQPVRPVSANAVDHRSGTAFYLLASPAGTAAAPPGDDAADGGEIVGKAIEIQINTFAGGGLHQDVIVTNHALAATTITLDWELAADFADMDEVVACERKQTAAVLRRWTSEAPGQGELRLAYDHARLDHACLVRFVTAGTIREVGHAIRLTLQLAPRQETVIGIDVAPVFLGEALSPWYGLDGAPTARHPAPSLEADWLADCTTLETDSVEVQAAWTRAVQDLASLHRLTGEGAARLTPMAGIPKYTALFGRDTLVAGLQSVLLSPSTLEGSLLAVGEWTAKAYHDATDAQPGKVLHQRQRSPLSLLGENPFLHYYGDYSAPGLFVLGAAAHFAQTGDRAAFASVRDNLFATLAWMDRDGDIDGDGFYEYRTLAGAAGIQNQGWKDSGQAILYGDGSLVKDPIAVVEVQALYYAAKQALAGVLLCLGERAQADDLMGQAAALKARFNAAFWLPEERYVAIGLDADKRPIRTVASDPGTCLSYGILDADKAIAVRDRLMAPDLFTGWGIRTLSSDHPAYNPLAYHLGTVWPVSTANVCFGLKRHGFVAAAQTLAAALFEASSLFDYNRLPEVFGGHPRDTRHPHPGIYPDACSPQAWSASAVVHLCHTLSGVTAVAPLDALILDPVLPAWLPRLTLRNIVVGARRVSLALHREGDQVAHEVLAGGEGLRILRPERQPEGEDGLAHALRALTA